MATQSAKLKAGDTIEINGTEVTVEKCGMNKEGNSPAVPVVTLSYDDGEPDPDVDDDDQAGDDPPA